MASAERPAPAGTRRIPLVVHVVRRMALGGLENGMVNLINRTPVGRYRHAVVSLTDCTDFAGRIRSPDTPVFALRKRPGNDPGLHFRFWVLMRRLRPDIVHTRNLAALEMVLPAVLAGVPARVHGEHGWDVHDLHGQNARYSRVRRALRPYVDRYIALSREIEHYLIDRVGVARRQLTQVYNGVDLERFRPPAGDREPLPHDGFAAADSWVIGTVGRLGEVKDQSTLARAFVALRDRVPEAWPRLRLVIVGQGPLADDVRRILAEGGAALQAWLPGDREDVPRLLRGMDVFALPSLAEGISNGILEAMASGRPTVATAVGGNPELVREGQTGWLVPSADPAAMADALARYVRDPAQARRHGAAARSDAQARFGLERMVERYLAVYDSTPGQSGN